MDRETALKTAEMAVAVADMLREYADMMERGEMPAMDGPTALRHVAVIVEGVAEARVDAAS